MESRELRIGNWVYNETTRENMEVYPMMIPQLNRLDGTSHNIKPIPITEEILLKCGFVIGMRLQNFVKGKYCFVDKKDGIVYGEFSEEGIFYFNSKTKMYYIHQLQNLYFALTGQELEIKL